MTRLKGALGAMGMPSAFAAGSADFSGIDGTRDLFIGDVVHKAFVTVDEKGTEAAAATVDYGVGAAMKPPPIEVRADHPFLFVLKDTTSVSVLFMGRIADPRG